MWRYQIPPLAQRYSLICPDLRGLGWSEAPPTGYEKEQLVDDIIALLDALNLDHVRLMAHDWGGWVGFLFCLRQPERIQRYLALNILLESRQHGKVSAL
jgi:pimeloyl-ACP methyl ester carboxylesterase